MIMSVAFKNEISDVENRAIHAQTLEELMKRNDRILYLDADLIRSAGMYELWRKMPDRVIECGVAEANMVGIAAGLSSEGYVPFIHSFAPFMSRRVFDQVYMSCAYAKQNVKIIGTDPGVTAALNGGTHTANEDIAMMRTLPNITIFDLADCIQLKQALQLAAAHYGVVYLRYPRVKSAKVYSDTTTFQLGKAITLREGVDLTIIASGIEVPEALIAAEKLYAIGISAQVIDMFTVAPIDKDAILEAAQKTKAIVTAENHSINGGLGSAVAEVLVENYPIPLERVGNALEFGDVGSIPYLMKRYGIDSDAIVEKSKKVLCRK